MKSCKAEGGGIYDTDSDHYDLCGLAGELICLEGIRCWCVISCSI